MSQSITSEDQQQTQGKNNDESPQQILALALNGLYQTKHFGKMVQLSLQIEKEQYDKSKWMDKDGFRNELKQNNLNLEQVWKETPPISSGVIDPYEDGNEQIGNRFRTRRIIKETEAQQFLLKLRNLHKGSQSPQNQKKAVIEKVSFLDEKESESSFQPQLNSNPSVSNLSDIAQKNNKQSSGQQNHFNSRKNSFSYSAKSSVASTVQLIQVNNMMKERDQQNNQKNAQITSILKPTINDEYKSSNQQMKSYIKSLEQHIPCGIYTSSLYKDQQLSKEIQLKTFGRTASQLKRPTSGMSQNSVFNIVKTRNKEEQIHSNFIRVIDDNNKQLQLLEYEQLSPKNRPSTSVKSPQNALHVEFQSRKASHESEIKIKIKRPVTALKNLKQAQSQINLYNANFRPESAITSLRTRLSNNNYLLSVSSGKNSQSQLTFKEAISKHFDK
ncbi:UNKNOWN [Stylonychia lemnae]|uniref:Uncharacterized protein n=1 Tax=Stylonychia lemnae TaxID=5949 RepID=A0A078B6I3_STYLE|nr:UNKNOWN [Stylonychia lemnae]|eukprot:CDW89173.1 UNKNOWN [Stylonychia lemnae]